MKAKTLFCALTISSLLLLLTDCGILELPLSPAIKPFRMKRLFLSKAKATRESQAAGCATVLLKNGGVCYSRFCSPHSHIPSKIGIRDLPRSVRLYSTLGGICGYSLR